MQFHCQVIRYLTTHRNDDTTRRLQLDHIEHALQRKFVEIQAVAHVVVGRNGLRVVVNHDRFVTQLASGVDGVNRTPVELNRRTDTVSTRTEYYHRFLIIIIINVVCSYIFLTLGISECWNMGVGEVEVVGKLRMLRGNCWDALNRWHYAALLTILANSQILLLHISTLWLENEAGNLEIAETATFYLQQQLIGQFLKLIILQQLVLQVDNMLQALQEPNVNLGKLLDTLDGVALFESLSDSKDTQVGWVSQLLVEVIKLGVVVAHETVHALTNHTQALLNHLLEAATDTHNLTNRFHRRTNLTAHTSKLSQVPTRNLTDHIVETWCYIST